MNGRLPGERRQNARALLVVIGLIAGLFLLAVTFVIWSVGVNNRLGHLDDAADAQWLQVHKQHERLLKLTRNLVSFVRESPADEPQAMTSDIEKLASASRIPKEPEVSAELQEFAWQQRELRNTLTTLLLALEQSPGMRTNQSFLSLKTELEDVEKQVAVERKKFNRAVLEYNAAIREFPAALVSSLHNLKKRPLLKVGSRPEASDNSGGSVPVEPGPPGGSQEPGIGSPPQDAQSVPPPPRPALTPDRNLPPEGNLRRGIRDKTLALEMQIKRQMRGKHRKAYPSGRSDRLI